MRSNLVRSLVVICLMQNSISRMQNWWIRFHDDDEDDLTDESSNTYVLLCAQISIHAIEEEEGKDRKDLVEAEIACITQGFDGGWDLRTDLEPVCHWRRSGQGCWEWRRGVDEWEGLGADGKEGVWCQILDRQDALGERDASILKRPQQDRFSFVHAFALLCFQMTMPFFFPPLLYDIMKYA